MNTKSKTKMLQAPTAQRRIFTVEQANLAIPYVSKVTGDIRTAYRRAVQLQELLDETPANSHAESVRVEYEETIGHLNRYVDELHDVGVELKDYELGLVDFPAIHEGREVLLCWKYGEQQIVAWHETDAGFSGRKKIASMCKATPIEPRE